MKKEEIIVMLGTAHLDEILGKCSPDKSLRECVYSREIVADVKAKLESYGYKVFVDYEPLNKSAQMTGSGTLQSRELEYRVRVVNNLCAKYGKAKCLYVSIHVNAAGADGKWHGAGGWCCYTSKGRTTLSIESGSLLDSLTVTGSPNLNVQQTLRNIYDERSAGGATPAMLSLLNLSNVNWSDTKADVLMWLAGASTCHMYGKVIMLRAANDRWLTFSSGT